MSRERCKVIADQDYCRTNQKGEACDLFPVCSVLNGNQNGDLTPIQFHEKFPDLMVNQLVKIAVHLNEIDQQNRTPLRSLEAMLLKQDYIIPGTEICIFEGKDGRKSTCPNNPARETPKVEKYRSVCVRCSTYPDLASK